MRGVQIAKPLDEPVLHDACLRDSFNLAAELFVHLLRSATDKCDVSAMVEKPQPSESLYDPPAAAKIRARRIRIEIWRMDECPLWAAAHTLRPLDLLIELGGNPATLWCANNRVPDRCDEFLQGNLP